MFSTWKKIHEDLIQEKERSKIVPLSGNHYVYYKHGPEIAKTVTDWILNDQRDIVRVPGESEATIVGYAIRIKSRQ